MARVLASDPAFAAWDDRRRREAALLAALRPRLPRPVADQVRIGDASGPTLELAAASGAIATVLRQKGADILAQLGREGWQFTGLRVRVQPRAGAPITGKGVPRQWDSRSRDPLAALAATLPAGPLRDALRRFLRKAG